MRSALLFVLFCSIALAAQAGEVYGTIVENGKPIPAGAKIEITAAGKSFAGETDKFGSYHIFVAEKGKSVLTLAYKDQKPTAEVFSYEKSTRYDWTVETADGKLVLKRK
jgi:hypothetical protein